MSGIIHLLTAITLLIILAGFVLYLITAIISGLSTIPYVGSKQKNLKNILKEANLKPGGTFYDLGSGDGRVVIIAAKHFKQNATGYEFNPFLVVASRIASKILKAPNAKFIRKDARKADIHDADAIYVFLLPRLLKPIGKKIVKECKKGTIIISHGFSIPALKDKKIKTREEKPFLTHYYKL